MKFTLPLLLLSAAICSARAVPTTKHDLIHGEQPEGTLAARGNAPQEVYLGEKDQAHTLVRRSPDDFSDDETLLSDSGSESEPLTKAQRQKQANRQLAERLTGNLEKKIERMNIVPVKNPERNGRGKFASSSGLGQSRPSRRKQKEREAQAKADRKEEKLRKAREAREDKERQKDAEREASRPLEKQKARDEAKRGERRQRQRQAPEPKYREQQRPEQRQPYMDDEDRRIARAHTQADLDWDAESRRTQSQYRETETRNRQNPQLLQVPSRHGGKSVSSVSRSERSGSERSGSSYLSSTSYLSGDTTLTGNSKESKGHKSMKQRTHDRYASDSDSDDGHSRRTRKSSRHGITGKPR